MNNISNSIIFKFPKATKQTHFEARTIKNILSIFVISLWTDLIWIDIFIVNETMIYINRYKYVRKHFWTFCKKIKIRAFTNVIWFSDLITNNIIRYFSQKKYLQENRITIIYIISWMCSFEKCNKNFKVYSSLNDSCNFMVSKFCSNNFIM
jgi:hypothetical protein